jgi:methylenetetrahydrofolate dehydrogenase (NADP+)/methenyltetrahydrofolate cyclohydrolase
MEPEKTGVLEMEVGTWRLLDGKRTRDALHERIAREAVAVQKERGRPPHLGAILVGEDGPSQTYVASKVKACEAVGFNSTLLRLPASTSSNELLAQVEQWNRDARIDGFIVQLPLPKHIDERAVTLAIDPLKDVDGFHPANLGRMMMGLPCFLPATPSGILELFKHHGISTAGKHCVVVGRSHIVGTPMSILMSRNAEPGNCTVTLAHSRTKDLASITRQADILIVAIGKVGFITGEMVKQGAVVVDVGIEKVPDPSRASGYRFVGDVDFPTVAPKCAWITPVPGGVGPMTVTSLLLNTLKAARA